MQPSDTTPMPQPPKQGFFAKLFGKKPKGTPLVPAHESQTPPPQLGDSPSTDVQGAPVSPVAPVAPTVGIDVTSPNDTPPVSDFSAPVSSVGVADKPSTLDVPPVVVVNDGTTIPPALPTDTPVVDDLSAVTPPEESKENSPPNPRI